jgi:hypothetical protein
MVMPAIVITPVAVIDERSSARRQALINPHTPKPSGNRPTQPHPSIRDDHQPEGHEQTDRHQDSETQVLAGDDLPPSRPPGPGGKKQHGQDQQIIEIAAGEHTERYGDGPAHLDHFCGEA